MTIEYNFTVDRVWSSSYTNTQTQAVVYDWGADIVITAQEQTRYYSRRYITFGINRLGLALEQTLEQQRQIVAEYFSTSTAYARQQQQIEKIFTG